MALDPTTQDAASTESGPRTLERLSAPERVRWRLHVLASPDPELRGRVLALRPGMTTLGRSPGEGGVAVADRRLSRSHVSLRWTGTPGDTVELRDEGSRNGTWVAGRRMGQLRLGDGALLRIGDTVAVLEEDRCAHEDFDAPSAEVPGRSAAARKARADLHHAAQTGRPVLLEGATGTGKEHAAALLHRSSQRAGPLVRVNVSALPENLFESLLFGHPKGAFTGAREASPGRIREAEGGTLVLDEVGELPLALQPKLLRALEAGAIRPVGGRSDVRVDVRFIASTNADLDQLVADKRFRRDLRARLATHHVRLPALRQRRADLIALSDAVVPRQDGRSWAEALSADAVEALLLCAFDDNLRGLTAALLHANERAHGPAVGAKLLPPALIAEVRGRLGPSAQTGGQGRAGRPSRQALEALLREHGGNIEAVGRALGRDRRQVYRWLAYVGIDKSELERLRGEG